MASVSTSVKNCLSSVRFDRNELAGAFGDIGTSLPLMVGVTLAANLDGTSVLVMFGLMQILTGVCYGMPMPVQPLKAMAAIVIAQNVGGPILCGAGLAIGISMLFLSVSGAVDWLSRVIPKSVIRGIQFGLGMQLATLALKQYIPADGVPGYWLALVAFSVAIILLGNRKYPAALFLVLAGVVYAVTFKGPMTILSQSTGVNLPEFNIPRWQDILTGFYLLALPQIPLSLGNSLLATRQVAQDLFPACPLTVRKIGLTYSVMNLINPFFGGIPTCHGSGGMAGHYTFGARTGGSVIIIGTLYICMGLFWGQGFNDLVKVFPLPVLGVILVFEGLALMMLVRDMLASKGDLAVVLLVGLLAIGLPYGYLIGMVVGVLLAFLLKHGKTVWGEPYS